MNKFKEGDRVRSENTGYESMSEMTRGEVVGTPGCEGGLYEVKVISGIFRDEWNKEYFTDGGSWSFRESELEPFSFKVGDYVEIVKVEHGGRHKVGDRDYITEVFSNGVRVGKGLVNNYSETELKLIKGGSAMCEKSLRDRIEALPGWTKEADDLLREMMSFGNSSNYVTNWEINNENHDKGFIRVYFGIKSAENKNEVFYFDSQYSKLRAFKDALLWLLDKSGLEKVDKEKDELLKQIAELKSHHEQEGQKIKEMEDKVNGRG